MNSTLDIIYSRKSVRAFEDKPIPQDIKDEIIKSAMRAPTAGNMMLYSIIDITDQNIKNTLAKTCDNQPFIAKAPLVLLFFADYQRWVDYFINCGVEELCLDKNETMRHPQEGDLMLACCDALIAAQSSVIAAESLGIGSCYIGDIMENYEIHKELLNLPEYVFPISMVCFGYPTEQQKIRTQPDRFSKEYVVFENKYKSLSTEDFYNMYKGLENNAPKNLKYIDGATNLGQHMYLKKFSSEFSNEMSRSARKAMESWKRKDEDI